MTLPSALLVLGAWICWTVVLIGLGLLFLNRQRKQDRAELRWRASLWLGLWLLVITAVALHLAMPLGGTWGLVVVAVLWVVGLGSIAFSPRAGGRPVWSTSRARWSLPLLGALLFVLVLAAFWAVGNPTNYDLGLYHLGSISYTSDYRIIPGLANLHDRFGFNSSMWPVSSLLGTGPLADQGFRVLNGLIMTMMLADLALRVGTGRRARRPSAGTYVLAIGMVLAFSVGAQYPGRLLASSANDMTALLLTVVSTAYLLDFVDDRRSSNINAVVSIIVGTATATVRPLGWVFVAATVVVGGAALVRRGGWAQALRALLLPVGLSALTLVVMLVRDAILSGWLLFPLSKFPLPVDWRVVDPQRTADDITGWARTPFQDVQVTLADNSWIAGWFKRLFTEWATPTLVVMLLVLVALLIWPRGRDVARARWHVIGAALIPTLVALAAWFVNAPDPRFAWGNLVSLGAVPIAVIVSRALPAPRFAAMAAFVVLGLLVFAGLRGSFTDLSSRMLDVPEYPVAADRLADGTKIVSPLPTDQCWRVFPMCTPVYASRDVVMRGPSIQDGFAPALS